MFENGEVIHEQQEQSQPLGVHSGADEIDLPLPGVPPEQVQEGLAAEVQEGDSWSPEALDSEQPRQPEAPEEAAVAAGGSGDGSEPPEKAHLTSDDEGDGHEHRNKDAEHGEADSAEAPPEIIIDSRRIGEVEVTTALCAHAPENYAEIARALEGSEIVAFEGPGFESAVGKFEAAVDFSHLVSADIDPKEAERGLALPAAEGSGVAGVLYHLRGTDKHVAFLDMTQDHPDYHLCQETDEARQEYGESFLSLAPLERARAACHRGVSALSAEIAARDAILAEELYDWTTWANSRQDPPSFGVMLGTLHHRTLELLQEKVTGTAGEPNAAAEQFEQATLHHQAVAAFRDGVGDARQRAELVDRALISDYCAPFYLSHTREELDKRIREFSSEKVEALLGALSEDLADAEEAPVSKLNKVRATVTKALG